MRRSMWKHAASRSHKPEKSFPFGPNADEVMMFGTVSYGLKNRMSKKILGGEGAFSQGRRRVEDGLLSSISG